MARMTKNEEKFHDRCLAVGSLLGTLIGAWKLEIGHDVPALNNMLSGGSIGLISGLTVGGVVGHGVRLSRNFVQAAGDTERIVRPIAYENRADKFIDDVLDVFTVDRS